MTEAPVPVPPIVLAPLQGVTTAVFRRVFARHFRGVDRALSPFVTTTTGHRPHLRHFKDVLPANNRDSLPLVPQLLGKDGGDFRDMANFLHDEFGYAEVNWNAGCPSPTVTTRGRGAGILAWPDRFGAFLDAACAGLRPRLSVKLRLGQERDDEFRALVDALNGHPVAEVTIHPRTGRQQYAGRADVDRFAEFKALLRHPVAYNGDLCTTEAARGICARFPDLSSLMIGRGLLANPALAGAIVDGRPEGEALAPGALGRFHDDLYATYRATLEGGPGPTLARMKELWSFWEPALPGARKVLKSRTYDEYEAAVDRALGRV